MGSEYGIGDFSILCRLTVKALRYYQEEGLIQPSRVDEWSGYRYYGEDALDRARLVKTLRDWDFTIAEIRSALALARSDEELKPFLRAKLAEMERHARELKIKQSQLETLIDTMGEEDMKVSFDIVIKELAAFRAATNRVKGSYSDYGKYVSGVFSKFGRWMGGKPLCFYYDEEYKEGDADFEPGIPLRVGAPTEGTREVPACRAACIVHQGSYDSLHRSYQALTDYVKKNGLEVLRPTREIYLKGPGMFFKGNPAKYLTEIQFPIK